MNSNTSDLIDIFRQKYGEEDVVVEAPGRINLLGEHTDYNEGYVLPAAINKVASFVISKSGTDLCEIIAHDLDKVYQFSLEDDLQPVDEQWANYFLGVIHGLTKVGAELKGFNLIFSSDIPIGAGLSSSAALEVGFGFALNELFSLKIDKRALALIGQKAEHDFAGVNCGIMDQFASALSKSGHVMQLDCRTQEIEFIPADFEDFAIVLFDTKVKHELASTEYNVRREQCAEGVEILRKVRPEIASLRDVSILDLENTRDDMPRIIYNRCQYVIEENLRVLEASKILDNGDVEKLGNLMYQTHKGLTSLYEVSCEELDILVDVSMNDKSYIGSRMMGGGFGGCTLNLIQKDALQDSIAKAEQHYLKETGIKLGVYIVELSEGVRRINLN